MSNTPILPLSIMSTSFPGIALMDYNKKGDKELDLVKDDALRVFKHYNHWSYVSSVLFSIDCKLTPFAVCQRSGWILWMGTGMIALYAFLACLTHQSWFIGKVSATGVVPLTLANMSSLGLDGSSTQVSPLSSAFPPVQSRNDITIGWAIIHCHLSVVAYIIIDLCSHSFAPHLYSIILYWSFPCDLFLIIPVQVSIIVFEFPSISHNSVAL